VIKIPKPLSYDKARANGMKLLAVLDENYAS